MSKTITNLERKRRRGLKRKISRTAVSSGGAAAYFRLGDIVRNASTGEAIKVTRMEPDTSAFATMLNNTLLFGGRGWSGSAETIKWLEDDLAPRLTTAA